MGQHLSRFCRGTIVLLRVFGDPENHLSHYTRSVQGLANILAHGLMWSPNPRGLMCLMPDDYVVPETCGHEEPEQFGMISLTEWPPPAPLVHRRKFGSFAVVVDRNWARGEGARPVEYVESGSDRAKELRAWAARGYADYKRKILFPDDSMWKLGAGYAPAAASINGAMDWASFLMTYRYLERAANQSQSEWRIVDSTGVMTLAKDRERRIAAVSPPVGWHIYTNLLHIPSVAVVGFVAPIRGLWSLAKALPAEFRDRPVAICMKTT